MTHTTVWMYTHDTTFSIPAMMKGMIQLWFGAKDKVGSAILGKHFYIANNKLAKKEFNLKEMQATDMIEDDLHKLHNPRDRPDIIFLEANLGHGGGPFIFSEEFLGSNPDIFFIMFSGKDTEIDEAGKANSLENVYYCKKNREVEAINEFRKKRASLPKHVIPTEYLSFDTLDNTYDGRLETNEVQDEEFESSAYKPHDSSIAPRNKSSSASQFRNAGRSH